MEKVKPTTISQYIKAAPDVAQEKLKELHAILKSVAPKATEAIKWGSPVFEENRILFSFSAFKSHMNFMPTRRTLDHFRDDIKDYKTGMDTIQFPYDKPLPKALIKKIATHRAKDVRENDAKWM
jgi:uncharacterized protein YdhG (YjbR/CyaY superfamily)